MLQGFSARGDWRRRHVREVLDELAPRRHEDAEILRWIHHLLVQQARREEIDAVERARDRARALAERGALASIQEAEFRVFSQWGEDGILQYLTQQVPIEHRVFVEFGVEDYTESNTRLLLLKDDWRGLVMDADRRAIDAIRQQEICWRHELELLPLRVTAENIGPFLTSVGIEGDIGVLSIDIDGNDYWVWKAIETIRPRIVVCEYNAIYGPSDPVVIPYDPAFERQKADPSCLYFGASIAALCRLAAEKRYRFVGTGSAGVNAFFVREDVAGDLPVLTPEQGYSRSRVRESRGVDGRLSFLSGRRRREAIGSLELLNLDTGRRVAVRDLAPEPDDG